MYPVAGRREADMDFPPLMRLVWTTGPYVIRGFKSHEPQCHSRLKHPVMNRCVQHVAAVES